MRCPAGEMVKLLRTSTAPDSSMAGVAERAASTGFTVTCSRSRSKNHRLRPSHTMSCPAPRAPPGAGAPAPPLSAAPVSSAWGWMSQLNLPGRETMRVPVARSISRPCGSASVCRKLARSVLRLSRYASRGEPAAAALTVTTLSASAASARHRRCAATGCQPATGLAFRRRRREHVACTVGLQRADKTCNLHGLKQSRRTVVANLEAPLHVGNGGLALGSDDAHRLVIERVGLRALPRRGARLRLLACEPRDRGTGPGEHLLDVTRRRRGPERVHDAVDFLVGDEGAVHA